MMRRISVFGSILLALSALAAIGLAQGGQRGEQAGNSLADRLTALRESVKTGAPASSAAPTDPHERSVLSATQPAVEPSAVPLRQEPATEDPQARPRRPRLLSALDPLKFLSPDDEGEDESRRTADAHERPGLSPREPSQLRRETASFRDRAPTTGSTSVPAVERHYEARRSPAVRRAEEIPSVAAEPTEPEAENVAVGPGGSESVTLPSLDRPIGSLSAAFSRAGQGADDKVSDATPDEHSLESATADLQPSTLGMTERYQQEPFAEETPSEEPATTDAASDAMPLTEEDPADLETEPADETEGVVPFDDSHAPSVAAEAPSTAVSPAAPRETAPREAEQVLSSDEAPAVAWEVNGPRQIIVGREATFAVHLRNDGGASVERLVSRIEIPASAEIVSAEASHGVGQRVEDGANSAVLEWRIDQLASADEAVLKLRVIPRTSHAMNIQVAVRSEPRGAVARVEVLEPKLKLALEGPSDVLHGESRTYRVTVTNPGTGPAENVVVLFTPPGEEESSAQRHAIGVLTPGDSRTIELEVTPHKAGDLAMKVVASGDGDLRDLSERRVLVRKPELVVDARGPRTTYAGTVATYYFRVQNTGDAIAKNVTVATHLPMGAEFIRAADDRKLEPKADKDAVTWDIGSLSPGEELFIELKCLVNWAGENTLELAAETAGGELQHSKAISTHVVALADLKLEVTDPKGPVAVGKEAVYEVRIKNRGSNAAEQVNVVALFSEGIDPVGVEGGQHSIENGRVAFRTIEGLAAGREIVFKIRAVAKQPGTHVFRAEVLCRELETKLAAEETTRFYLDEAGPGAASGFQAAVHEELVRE